MSSELRRYWVISIIFSAVAALGVFLLRPYTSDINFLPDEGFNWYYWKLPEPTFWSRASSWGLYFAHQFFIWGAIYWAKQHRDQLTDWSKMHKLNYVVLGGTAIFIGLHYLQTAIFFDGLAQDVPVIISQGSVVVLLIVVLVMEAPRRGLFFGNGKTWFASIQGFLYRNHGYFFAWATIFTFWYHPMYPTWGHVTGYFYMFLIFTQIGFMYTSVHVYKPWSFTIEALVVLHAVIMAFTNGLRQGEEPMWAMFGFGFAALIVVTQMFGLNLTKLQRWLIAGAYIAAVAVTYSARGWDKLNEIIRIPVIDYLGAFLIGAGLIFYLQHIRKKQNTN